MKELTRRMFIAGSTMVVAGAAGFQRGRAQEVQPSQSGRTGLRPLFVSTWPFGKAANDVALETVRTGGSVLDGVEMGIRLTEANVSNASVGHGGIPNADGKVQLDACIMSGPGHKAGSVAAIEDVFHPITAARRVMENTPHVMLAGKGARDFAKDQGLKSGNLLTAKQRRQWREWRREQKKQIKAGQDNHDTISLVGLDSQGNLAGGCSTSGLAYKQVGRVGDSPIIGSGLYVDNEVGAAGATGVGENVMRFCGAFLVVEFMRQGLHPEKACVETIKRIARLDGRDIEELFINFVALDKQGRYGAAGTGNGFQYSVTYPDFSEVLQSAALSNRDVGAVGGNQPEKL